VRTLGSIVVLCACLALVGCGESDTSANGSNALEAPFERPKPKVVPQGPTTNKLVVKDLIEGTGAVAEEGDEALYHYVAGVYERGEEIESGWVKGSAFVVKLGSHTAKLPRLEEGMEGMRVGGRRAVIFPTTPDRFPPGSELGDTLVYVVDLLEIKR
jgi:FKBP-type peptidyl-prolyl cis-trans isomerase